MDEVKKVLFIVNRFAGGGYDPSLEGRIHKACRSRNIEAVIEYTNGPRHATALAAAALNTDVQCVVAVGGDGTLNEVAQALVRTPVPMGIIPRGSGNGLARHLCIPLQTDAALNALFTGKPAAMDTFTLNNKLSLNVSGIGFDGHVANLFGGKTKRGLAGYTKLTIKEYISFREFEAEITLGEVVLKRNAFVIAFANSDQYGNNACIAPGASVSDGILHMTILKKIPPYRLDFVYALFAKTIDQLPFSEIREVKNVRVATPFPIPYHVDGEPCGAHDSFDVTIFPSSLQMIIPGKNVL
jgi:diacylglycerol kinase (ATP)